MVVEILLILVAIITLVAIFKSYQYHRDFKNSSANTAGGTAAATVKTSEGQIGDLPDLNGERPTISFELDPYFEPEDIPIYFGQKERYFEILESTIANCEGIAEREWMQPYLYDLRDQNHRMGYIFDELSYCAINFTAEGKREQCKDLQPTFDEYNQNRYRVVKLLRIFLNDKVQAKNDLDKDFKEIVSANNQLIENIEVEYITTRRCIEACRNAK